MYTNAQLRTCYDSCKNDIVYFDATGSTLKRFKNEKDFQIYTMLVRNLYERGPSPPVASFISACHDANTIRHIKEVFQNDTLKLCCSKTSPQC